jgi:formate dehydrogenase subunit gamma
MERQTTESRVLKHSRASRLFHWGLLLGFLPAAATGLILWLKPGNEWLVQNAMRVHIFGAIVLTASAAVYSLCCFKRVVAFIRRAFSWSANDVGWLLVGGGYPQKLLLGKKIAVPPMGKINSGQKIFSLCILFGGVLVIGSGWLLFAFIPLTPKAIVVWADRVHLGLGLFLTLFMVVHIFLGIYNWGEFKAMFGDGTQPLAEAKENNPLWVEQELEPAGKIRTGV